MTCDEKSYTYNDNFFKILFKIDNDPKIQFA